MSEFDLPVSSHMVAPVQTLLHTERLTCAARRLDELGVSALPVIDGSGRLMGMLERSDLLRTARLRHASAPGESRWWWPDVPVSEHMQASVPVSAPTQPLRQCAQRMLDRHLNRVYVLAGDDLAGVISTRELMRAVARAGLATALRELAAGMAEPVSAAAPIGITSARFAAGSGQPLVVLDGATPSGVFGHAELRACLEADPELATRSFMDERIIVLAADLPAHRAAEQAVANCARYIVVHDPAHGYRVLSGHSFAACIAGSAASESQPIPPLTLAPTFCGDTPRIAQEFRAAVSAGPERVPALAGALPSFDAKTWRADERRREPTRADASEPEAAKEASPARARA